jgi:hypothetical protein
MLVTYYDKERNVHQLGRKTKAQLCGNRLKQEAEFRT